MAHFFPFCSFDLDRRPNACCDVGVLSGEKSSPFVLRQNAVDDFAMHVRQTEIAAGEFVG